MGRVVAIDPGVKALGWALFEDDELTACGLIRANSLEDMIAKLRKADPSEACVVIERPQIYPQSKWKGDPNDLIAVALAAGAAAMAFQVPDKRNVRFVLPREWKKTVPKKIMGERILSRLKPMEQYIFNNEYIKPSLQHNTIDAIGIGLWQLERL